MSKRDPLKDPRPGDVVLPVGAEDIHRAMDVKYHPLTVRARVDQLVAFTEDGAPNKVVWLLLSSWCEVFEPITEWKVIHKAEGKEKEKTR